MPAEDRKLHAGFDGPGAQWERWTIEGQYAGRRMWTAGFLMRGASHGMLVSGNRLMETGCWLFLHGSLKALILNDSIIQFKEFPIPASHIGKLMSNYVQCAVAIGLRDFEVVFDKPAEKGFDVMALFCIEAGVHRDARIFRTLPVGKNRNRCRLWPVLQSLQQIPPCSRSKVAGPAASAILV